jgi:hypothetical protein
MKTRIVMTALLVTVLAMLGAAVSVSAAPPPQKASPRTVQVKYRGTTKFAPSPKAPVSNDKAVNINAHANRPIPGKARSAGQVGVNIPTVSPLPISTSFPGKTAQGLNAYDNRYVGVFNVTPPDQGLCVGNGYVVEPVNIVLSVYDEKFRRQEGDMSLETFFGYSTSDFNVGDPKCYYDPNYGGHFFVTVYDSDFSTYSQVDIAVSQTANPLLGWNLYSIDTLDTGQGDCPCFGDQPLLGANQDGILISTNQFPLGAGAFNGADLFVLDKKPLALGLNSVNAVEFLIGLDVPTPDGACDPNTGATCWYSTQPMTSPDTASWDARNGGTAYMLSALDFAGAGDQRIELWAVTNTSSIHGAPDLTLSEITLTSNGYAMPPNGVQKNDGNLPTGQFYYGWNPADGAGEIATNDDRMNATTYTGSWVWGALNTAVMQSGNNQEHAGIAYFGVKPKWNASGDLHGHIKAQGYVSPKKADAMFPSIGMLSSGRGVIAFSLSGKQHYPSAAYGLLGTTYSPTSVVLSTQGQSSLDDFCEYPAANCAGTTPPSARPRFGDYSAAVGSGNQIYFASEYVQYANCTLAQFTLDPTCGDTRANRTNWGTSLSKLAP